MRVRRKAVLVANFFGDGAVDEGAFHESLNFASLKKLPVIFVCENNTYAINSRQLDRQPLANICQRAEAYGIPAKRIEGNDVLAIHEAATRAVAALRAGEGPRFLECMTYRWLEHVGPGEDFALGYRTREEAAPWIADDQVTRLSEMLPPAERRQIKAEVETELREAFAFAEASPFPPIERLHADLYAESR
jgi:TPP-dependent pyruvate/acetoin dehydrogenase alpha subunit